MQILQNNLMGTFIGIGEPAGCCSVFIALFIKKRDKFWNPWLNGKFREIKRVLIHAGWCPGFEPLESEPKSEGFQTADSLEKVR